jgi:hypothetical protein
LLCPELANLQSRIWNWGSDANLIGQIGKDLTNDKIRQKTTFILIILSSRICC